jgi:hypothetical protein
MIMSGVEYDRRAAMRRRRSTTGLPETIAVLATLGIGCYVGFLSWFVRHYRYDLWAAAVFIPLLFAISLPLIRKAARAQSDPWLAKLLALALLFKLLAAPARYAVTSGLYGGVGDAHAYHQIGAQLAPLFRHGVFVGWQGKVPGTGFIEILTGAIYSVTGATELGGYVIFSWIGFWGLFWFYRAFCIAIPDGNRHRYAALVMLLPSLLFWPSSIGKEAWMTLGLGVTAYGVAKLFAHSSRGLPALLLGVGMTTIARPHLTLIVVVAIGFGYLVRPHPGRTMLAPLGKLIGIAVLIVVIALSAGQAQKFFQADQAAVGGSLSQALNTAQVRTSTGGSQFAAAAATSPTKFPLAFMTVIYRPYLYEARSGQTLIASLDGTLLLALTVFSWRGLRGLVGRLRRQPYLAFALMYVVLFVIGFSRFANFGILARQRVQVIPLFLVLLCLPARRPVATRLAARSRRRAPSALVGAP